MQATHQISPLQVLNRRVDGSRRHTADSSGNNGAATDGLVLGLHHPDVRLDEHVKIIDNVAWLCAADALQSTSDDELDERVLNPTLGHHINQDVLDLLAGERQLQPQLLA